MHRIRGLRQALLMVLGGVAVALVVGALWVAVAGGDFRPRFGIALMGVAGALAISGGTELSRASTNDVRAFFGQGPDREQPATGEALTALGIFLFVSVPLFLAGGLLYGRG